MTVPGSYVSNLANGPHYVIFGKITNWNVAGNHGSINVTVGGIGSGPNSFSYQPDALVSGSVTTSSNYAG